MTEWSEHRLDQHSQLPRPEQHHRQAPQLHSARHRAGPARTSLHVHEPARARWAQDLHSTSRAFGSGSVWTGPPVFRGLFEDEGQSWAQVWGHCYACESPHKDRSPIMSASSPKVLHSWSHDKLRPPSPSCHMPTLSHVPCLSALLLLAPPRPNVTSSSSSPPSTQGQIKAAFNLASVPSSSSPQLEMTAFIFSVLDYFPRFHNSRHYLRAPDANLLRLLGYAVR